MFIFSSNISTRWSPMPGRRCWPSSGFIPMLPTRLMSGNSWKQKLSAGSSQLQVRGCRQWSRESKEWGVGNMIPCSVHTLRIKLQQWPHKPQERYPLWMPGLLICSLQLARVFSCQFAFIISETWPSRGLVHLVPATCCLCSVEIMSPL